jgi:hypothetical protein
MHLRIGIWGAPQWSQLPSFPIAPCRAGQARGPWPCGRQGLTKDAEML